jgi:hypothetical protein
MDRTQDVKRDVANENPSGVSKKVYADPKLTVHGKVEDITRNLAPVSGNDASFYGSTM